jgi:SAM-dependent methyltransferase
VDNHTSAGPVSEWVRRWSKIIPSGGEVLDVACGSGRHSLYFAGLGHSVCAVDKRSDLIASFDRHPNIVFSVCDLENGFWPFTGRKFDCIVVTNYLHRALFPFLISSLSSQGVLIYETFMLGNEIFGKPSNPDFLLTPNELIDCFAKELTVMAFEAGLVEQPRSAVIQRICAVAGGYPYPGKIEI